MSTRTCCISLTFNSDAATNYSIFIQVTVAGRGMVSITTFIIGIAVEWIISYKSVG